MIFIDVCFKKKTPYTPIWLMRQAGRYLSEYKMTRQKAKNFLGLCKNPELASEVTLQPVDILGVDAAIIFSDILVIPMEMGMGLGFYEGEGPKFDSTMRCKEDLRKLQTGAFKRTQYVYDALKITREKLDSSKALIGFCGSPWTLATYMIEGEGSKTYTHSKRLLYKDPSTLHTLLEQLTEELKQYLEMQIHAGANAVMVFDSWAAALEKSAYFEFSWDYMKQIATYLKAKYPHIPIILFPKGIGAYLESIDGEFDVFGVDWGTPMESAKKILANRFVLQGNLEPARLYQHSSMVDGVEKIFEVMQDTPFIFNLGHGMMPDLPRESAIELVKIVQQKRIS
ncbi:uroporphyrinogen decarboxylase [Helicobacter monodelphidis]|uniref:uroporphyrinogen decarboxylase n=1 Tax=Helicobacter sp. 15-1451 TaxID=2004995 RepID=UPI000DCEFED3|nr:uroporphyrinogen decarboxylase [Helicobacter sp. 15-1451]RAX58840.1 uroporphyrinogen decarboxylase [Helicobacter sp. 15-1451]